MTDLERIETVDFFEKDDRSCLKRLRSLVALLPEAGETKRPRTDNKHFRPAKNPEALYELSALGQQAYRNAFDVDAQIKPRLDLLSSFLPAQS